MSDRFLRQSTVPEDSEASGQLGDRARKAFGASVYVGYAGNDLHYLNRVVKALGEVDPKLRVYSLLLDRRLSPGVPGITRKTLLGLTKLGERTLDRVLSWLIDRQLVSKFTGRSETLYFAI